MEINCEFRLSGDKYTCFPEANIIEQDHLIKEFKGIHKKGKSHKDVQSVNLGSRAIKYFPRGLEKHFPNLTQLDIFDGDIKKISKNDLKGLEELILFAIVNCELTSLPDDLFTEMPNLREVSFFGNKIEFASSDLLKPLIGRENVKVDLRRNKRIDACYGSGLQRPLKSLEELMKLIDEKCIRQSTVQPIFVPDLMDINCKFNIFTVQSLHIYECYVEENIIIDNNHEIKEFIGIHEKGKTHKYVKWLWFNKKAVKLFPRGLQKHFPNLTHLFINESDIKEISKSDLQGLEKLQVLFIQNAQLTSLPDDLFTEMKNLREISFYGNKIEFASSEVLKPLIRRNRVKVNLRGNQNINARYDPGVDGSLESLEELMKLIDKKCSKIALPTTKQEPDETALSTITDPHQTDFNSNFKEMWAFGRFSDLTIIANDKEFKVHKKILGMQSEVFAQLFESQDVAEIKLPNFSSQSVEALLKFIYTNEASEENANENFEIADQFKVAEMKSVYEKIICDQINKANAWETFLFAHRFSSQLIKEKAFHQIARNIKEDLPGGLMDDPETLKKLLEAREVYDIARRAYEEILPKSKKIKLTNN